MRFHPHTDEDRQAMLKAIGLDKADELYGMVPQGADNTEPFDLPSGLSEAEVERYMATFAYENHPAPDGPFFLGAGCYYHHIPATVDTIIQRGEFLTAYTPYQPEIAQGTLTYIFEFQSMIAAITGQDIANASMYDGATAATEAALMARRITKRSEILVHGHLHPDYYDTLATYWTQIDGTIRVDGGPTDKTACVLVQYPDFHGTPGDLQELRDACDKAGALLVVVVTEIVALGMLPPPDMADIVAGEAQSIGVPMNFGGPHLGFFACREKFVRQMPGRLCGVTEDEDGKRGFVLTLNTREQHIRRDKATSNICSNQGLCALAFTVHMALLGEEGFKELAHINHARACALADAMAQIEGALVINQHFFNEFVVELPVDTAWLRDRLADEGIIAGLPLKDVDGPAKTNRLLMAATEQTTDEDIERLVETIQRVMEEAA